MENNETQTMEIKSIREINEELQATYEIQKLRPEPIYQNQNSFNKWFLSILNNKVIAQSKGTRQFTITDENEWLINLLLCYLNRNPDDKTLSYDIKIENQTITHTLDLNKGITLLGNFGVGKTLIMSSVYENRGKLGMNGFFVSAKQLFDCKKPDLHGLIGKSTANLFLDDLGDEPMKKVDYGQEDTPVASVLKQKLDDWENQVNYPKLFITSNCGISKLKELYGGRIVSRLHGSTNVIITTQKQDFRKS